MVTTGKDISCTKRISINLLKALGEAVDYVKTELMPDFDFDAFNHDEVWANKMRWVLKMK